MNKTETSEFVNVRGLKVREVRKEYTEPDGSVHTAILVEDEDGGILFAPEFLSHTNEYVKVEVVMSLPGHAPEYYEIVGYDVNAHAMVGKRMPHSRAFEEEVKD